MAQVTAIRLGDNSAYLVEAGGERVLVDTGPDFRGAREQLLSVLGERKPSLVLATHGHLDHAGLGRWWQDVRGVPVAVGADDAHLARSPQLADDRELEGFRGWLNTCGAPADVRAEALHGLELRRDWARAAARPGEYPSIGRDPRWPTGLRYEHFEPRRVLEGTTPIGAGLEFLPMPGHTPGNAVAIHAGEGWLFAGDQLLPELTPVPAIQGTPPGSVGEWRFRSLPAFVRSLEQLAAMRFARCFPGHGKPFDNVAEVIAFTLGQAEQRTSKVAEALRESGRATVYGLSDQLYPRAVRRRFWQIAATIQGHLDLLEQRGLTTNRGEAYEWCG